MSSPETALNLDLDVTPIQTSKLDYTWKNAHREWGHSLHGLSPYVGEFPPALAHYFIEWFTEAGETVLDPFCGGGTTPLQAALHLRKGIGNDAFSYANTLSVAKCNPMDTDSFKAYLDERLEESQNIDNKGMRLLQDDDIKAFYSDYTLDQILRLQQVMWEKHTTEAHYLKAVICGILHGPSDLYLSLQTKDTFSSSVGYVKEYAEKHDLKKPERDIRPRAIRKHKLATKNEIPPRVNRYSTIVQTDARSLPFDDGVADLILTSPPYMHVLDYTWNNWIRLWWLGKDRDEERSSLDITSDVEKYRSFIGNCLIEMDRLLSDDGTLVLIVGDVAKHLKGGKQILNTASIIAEEAAKHTDMRVSGVIEDAYGVEKRTYVKFNQKKYDLDSSKRADEDLTTIDRCLILKKREQSGLPAQPVIDWEEIRLRQ